MQIHPSFFSISDLDNENSIFLILFYRFKKIGNYANLNLPVKIKKVIIETSTTINQIRGEKQFIIGLKRIILVSGYKLK